MTYDEGEAELLREALAGQSGISERRMFGGLAFMLDRNMVCGIHRDGAIFRVGKDREAEARAIPGTGPMELTGRPMGGMVEADADALADDRRRGQLMELALAHAKSLSLK